MDGQHFLDRILEYDRGPSKPQSPLLAAIQGLPHDKHDVIGAISVAREGLAQVEGNDPARQQLADIVALARNGQKYDRHDMAGVLFIARRGSDASPGPRR